MLPFVQKRRPTKPSPPPDAPRDWLHPHTSGLTIDVHAPWLDDDDDDPDRQ